MNVATFNKLVEDYSFSKAGDIEIIDNLPKFTNIVTSSNYGHVYLWVEQHTDERAIVYVGKAGKTIQERCIQHASGFKHSSTGKKHAARFRSGYREKKSYCLYVRKSMEATVQGESNIPMESVEELAFIKKFTPRWNKA